MSPSWGGGGRCPSESPGRSPSPGSRPRPGQRTEWPPVPGPPPPPGRAPPSRRRRAPAARPPGGRAREGILPLACAPLLMAPSSPSPGRCTAASNASPRRGLASARERATGPRFGRNPPRSKLDTAVVDPSATGATTRLTSSTHPAWRQGRVHHPAAGHHQAAAPRTGPPASPSSRGQSSCSFPAKR